MAATLTALRRSITPGTPVRVVNHLRPEASRETVVVTVQTNAFTTWATDKRGERVESWHYWKRVGQYRVDGNTVHVLDDRDGSTAFEYHFDV